MMAHMRGVQLPGLPVGIHPGPVPRTLVLQERGRYNPGFPDSDVLQETDAVCS